MGRDPRLPYSLSDNRVRAITEDRRGALWVGTHDGLNRLDRHSGRFERFRTVSGGDGGDEDGEDGWMAGWMDGKSP